MSDSLDLFEMRDLIFEALAAPFQKVRWRLGSTNKKKGSDKPATRGQALAYIDARDVMERLDQAVGLTGWSTRLQHVGNAWICELSLYLPSPSGEGWEWITRANAADATNIEASKGGASDAFKRAAVEFQVARYLYALESPWVDLTPDGRSIAPKEKKRLEALVGMREVENRPPHSDPDPKETRGLQRSQIERLMAAAKFCMDLEGVEADTQPQRLAWLKPFFGGVGVDPVSWTAMAPEDYALLIERLQDHFRELRDLHSQDEALDKAMDESPH